MLTAAEVRHFETFGFLVFRKTFSLEEMQVVAGAAEEVWEERLGGRPGEGEFATVAPFIEGHPALETLADDNRIYGPASGLLGDDLIWSGSEGNRGILRGRSAHHWHADREGAKELDYLRIKCMLYLDPTRQEAACLRLIPGSHHLPLHEDLISFRDRHEEDNPLFFGMPGDEVPCHAIETDPGDLVIFNQSLYHGVYPQPGFFGRGRRERRYIALKFAARPTTEAHIESLKLWSPGVFKPEAVFLHSNRPRIRNLVAGLNDLA